MNDQKFIASEVTATCNSLGKVDENDGTYMKDRDCMPCLRELMRFLRNDTTRHGMVVRHTLGALNIVKTDLIPLFIQYCSNDDDLLDLVLKICVNLTTPVQLLFSSKTEVDGEDFTRRPDYHKLMGYLYNYKEAFANSVSIWRVLVKQMRHYLRLDFDSRTEDDNMLFERIIILIRNILHIPVDASQDNGVHELCLHRMSQHDILDILHELTLSEHGDDFVFHIMEITMIMLRDFDPQALAHSTISDVNSTNSSAQKRKRSDHDRESDKKRLAELIARDKCQKAADKRRFVPQRFKGSTYQLKNTTVEYVVNRPIQFDIESIDSNKKQLLAPINRRAIKDTATVKQNAGSASIYDVRGAMKKFCIKFVENEYNQTMSTIKHILVRNQSQENDETYYSWAFYFFSAFNRHMNLPIDNISETISIDSLHYLQMLIVGYEDRLKLEKKNYEEISKRLHYAVKAYKEFLNYLSIISETALSNVGNIIKKTILCEQDYRLLLLDAFQEFNELKYSKSLLIDLVEANHTFLSLIEEYCAKKGKEKQIMVSEKIKRKKTRAKKAKKKIHQPNLDEKALIWAELSVSIIDALDGKLELPSLEDDPRTKPYHPASEKTLEEQKILVVKKLNKLLLDREALAAVALYRNARQVWLCDDEKPFGDIGITIDEELTALQDILMASLDITDEDIADLSNLKCNSVEKSLKGRKSPDRDSIFEGKELFDGDHPESDDDTKAGKRLGEIESENEIDLGSDYSIEDEIFKEKTGDDKNSENLQDKNGISFDWNKDKLDQMDLLNEKDDQNGKNSEKKKKKVKIDPKVVSSDDDDQDDLDGMSVRQTQFDFTNFVSRHYNPNVVKLHTKLLADFATNSDTTNQAILKLFQRLILDCGNMALFFNVRVFKFFLDLYEFKKANSGNIAQTLEQFLEIAKYTLEHFGKTSNQKRFLLLEPLFFGTVSDAMEVDVQMI